MRSLFALALEVLFLAGFLSSLRAEKPGDTDLLVPGAKPAPAAIVTYLEGPAADEKGHVYFSDLSGNRILKRAPDGSVTVFRADSGRTNGNTFDAMGRLISCEGAERGPGGRRRVVRTDLETGEVTVLTDRYQGKRYNSPNDVCVDVKGRIWFTDPYYGFGRDRSHLEMGVEGVYRIDPDGTVTRILGQPEVQRPNGLAVTPDAKTLYVADSNTEPGGNRKIWAFELSPEGMPDQQRLVYDFGQGRGGDGMRLDSRGNLWVAAGILTQRWPGETTEVPPGIYIISPTGRLLGTIPVLEDSVTNLTFGGPDFKTLYITAGKTLLQMPVAVPGYSLYPPRSR
jgi:gluconolactonase